MPPPKRGFPWVPFIIVLALIVGGVLFAVFAGEGVGKRDSGSGKDDVTTEAGTLPEITNSVPPDTSTTSTVTLQDCDPLQQLGSSGGAQPAVVDDGGDQIPMIGSLGVSGDPGAPAAGDDLDLNGIPDSQEAVPATIPAASGTGSTVTVDQDGNLCSGSAATTPPATTQTTPSTNSDDPDAGDGSWPAGRSGYTVVLLGFPEAKGYTETDANERAAEAQGQGLDSGVLLSDDFSSLCPGFWVVYSGVYDSMEDAEDAAEAAKDLGYQAAYARAINNTETADCTQAR